jgi:hypothetical protein
MKMIQVPNIPSMPTKPTVLCGAIMQFNQQRHLAVPIRVSGQRRPLYDRCLLDDVPRRNSKLKFESAHNGKEYRFHPKMNMCELVVLFASAIRHYAVDLLGQRKPVSDASARSTRKGEYVAPDTWYSARSFWN